MEMMERCRWKHMKYCSRTAGECSAVKYGGVVPADNRSAGSLATGVVSGFGFVLSLSTKPTNPTNPQPISSCRQYRDQEQAQRKQPPEGAKGAPAHTCHVLRPIIDSVSTVGPYASTRRPNISLSLQMDWVRTDWHAVQNVSLF